MKMSELIRYDVPPEVIRLWQQRHGEQLLPLQELAIKKFGLFAGLARGTEGAAPRGAQGAAPRGAQGGAQGGAPGARNLLVQAPTSSGKTFVGEMAAILTALRGKKVAYLAPLKALAEEKFEDFKEKYAPYGLKVIVSTRDHREFDAAFEAGDFAIAVVVYEKWSQLLVRRPQQLEEVALVIADELEILSDPERGPQVEVALTRMRQAPCRILGLSAVLGGADKLAEWMNAALLAYDRRPVDLRYGVLHNGVFKYRLYNEGIEGEEQLLDAPSESPWDVLTENLAAMVGRGEPCLVFVKARHESRRGAQLLARRLECAPAREAIRALGRLEPTHSRECLIETLGRGVGFHNADLSRQERRIVEEAFRSGELLALVSTSTLAMGMNLPAHNVFVAQDKWRYDARFSMPWKTPILRAEYENMGGRAGRFGVMAGGFGRAILIAPKPFDFETLWRRYIEGEREHVEPQLGQDSIEDHVLRLTAAHWCANELAIRDFMNQTLTGRWIWAETLTLEEIDARVRAAVNRLCDAGLIARAGGSPVDEEGRIEATPFGYAAAAKGIRVATACELAHWIQESETRLWDDLDLLLAAALTPDGRMAQVSLTAREYEQADYVEELKRRTAGLELAADIPLNRLRNCSLMPFFEEVRAVKTALFLADWAAEMAVYDIEERYHIFIGQITAAADQLSWLLDATVALAEAAGAHQDFLTRVATLSERVARGLRPESLALAHLGGAHLPRQAILRLVAEGLHTLDAVAEAQPTYLARLLPGANCEAIQASARSHAPDAAARAAAPSGRASTPAAPPPSPPVLVVDERRPDEILLAGKAIPLQDKQFRLIRLLAAFPGECVPYDAIYQSLWGELIVESNQMHFQKRRLLNRIKQAAPEHAQIVTTVPKRGFMLNLAPDQVALAPSSPATAASHAA